MLTDVIHKNFLAEAMPHFTELRNMASYLATNKTDAEDLVQETFMQAWKSFGKYKLGTNCRAWLFKILINKHRHHRRSKYIRQKYVQDVEEFVFLKIDSSTPIPEHLTNKEVIRALKKIPKLYRTTVILVDVYEFSYKEAAGYLEIPIGTVMSRLYRGRKFLRDIFVGKARNENSGLWNKFDYLLERYA